MDAIKQLFNTIPGKTRIDFYSFLATLLEGRFDIQKATGEVAKVLEQQADDVILEKSALKKAASLYRYIESEQRQGRGLHISLAGRVPDSELMMLLAGAEGDMVLGLRAAEDMAKSSSQRQSMIIKGVTYPIGVLCGVAFALNWIGNNLFATFEQLLPVEEWSPMGQRIYWVATNLQVWGPLLALILIGLAGLVFMTNKNVQGPLREKISWIPPLNVIRSVTGATYLRTLASLIKSGSTAQGALITMRDRTGSNYMEHYLEEAVSKMRAGVARQGPGKAIASKLFSSWVMVKLDIYSRGSIDEFTAALSTIADQAQNEALNSIGSLAKWLNLILMLIAAGAILGSVMTLLSISGSLQSGVS